jgi:hypothetical protein
MSSRGSAVIEVAAGLPEILACPWVAEHAVEFEPTGGGPYVNLIQSPGDQTNLTDLVTGHDHGSVHLDDVNWFDDAALIAAAPDASWQAYIGLDTEQAGLWLAYTPTTGLVEASHIDHDVMVPVDWANPADRTWAQEAQVARITTVRAALAAPGIDGPPRNPGSGITAHTSASAVPGSPTVRLTQPVPPTTPATMPATTRTTGRSLR